MLNNYNFYKHKSIHKDKHDFGGAAVILSTVVLEAMLPVAERLLGTDGVTAIWGYRTSTLPLAADVFSLKQGVSAELIPL